MTAERPLRLKDKNEIDFDFIEYLRGVSLSGRKVFVELAQSNQVTVLTVAQKLMARFNRSLDPGDAVKVFFAITWVPSDLVSQDSLKLELNGQTIHEVFFNKGEALGEKIELSFEGTFLVDADKISFTVHQRDDTVSTGRLIILSNKITIADLQAQGFDLQLKGKLTDETGNSQGGIQTVPVGYNNTNFGVATKGDSVFVASGFNNNCYFSTDSGNAYERSLAPERLALNRASSFTENTIYATSADPTTSNGGVFKSVDGGLSFTLIPPEPEIGTRRFQGVFQDASGVYTFGQGTFFKLNESLNKLEPIPGANLGFGSNSSNRITKTGHMLICTFGTLVGWYNLADTTKDPNGGFKLFHPERFSFSGLSSGATLTFLSGATDPGIGKIFTINPQGQYGQIPTPVAGGPKVDCAVAWDDQKLVVSQGGKLYLTTDQGNSYTEILVASIKEAAFQDENQLLAFTPSGISYKINLASLGENTEVSYIKLNQTIFSYSDKVI